MTTEALQDEEIHHSAGKDLLYSCPSELTFAQSGASSSPINISPLATISPPGIKLLMEQDNSRKQIILNININLTFENSVVNINHHK